MSLTLYIAFDKIIIKSVFQPLEKSFKSVFSAISEWCAHTGQASQYFRKAVSAHLSHALFFSHLPSSRQQF